MKFKLSSNRWITITISVYIAAVIALYIVNNYRSAPQIVSVADNLKPFDNLLPDTVTFHDHDKVMGTNAAYTINRNMIKYNSAGGSQFLFIGTTGGFNCDTCSIKYTAIHHFDDTVHQQSYIKLPYWKIKNTREKLWWYADSVKFHSENNQSYLRKVVAGPPSFDKRYKYHLVDVPVKFAYDQTNQYLLIPVSKVTKTIVEYFLLGTAFVLLVYALFLIKSFLGFIFDVSKGLAFTDQNTFRLKLIAISFILYPAIVFLLNLLMKIIFYSYFTADVVLSRAVWEDAWKPIGVGLVFLLLYRAFTQGKILKDEQDLTV